MLGDDGQCVHVARPLAQTLQFEIVDCEVWGLSEANCLNEGGLGDASDLTVYDFEL